MDPNTLHPELLRRAKRFSKALARDMAAVGAPEWPRRHQQPLARYLSRIVVGQQLSTKAAHTIWTRVEALADASAQAVPALALQQAPEALRACGLSAGKARTLRALAEAETEGRLDRAKLRRMPSEVRIAHLLDLPGVGPWTADMLALFYFREPDVWPLGDLTVRKAFGRYVEGQSRYDATAAAALFAPYRSILALYLWRITDAAPDR